MTTFLTAEGALALEEFLRENGLLKGLRRGRARDICEDLAGLVHSLIALAVLQSEEELKTAAILAGYDALDAQKARIFENVRDQVAWPQ